MPHPPTSDTPLKLFRPLPIPSPPAGPGLRLALCSPVRAGRIALGWRAVHNTVLLMCLLLSGWATTPADAGTGAVLDGTQPAVQLWPAVQLLLDPRNAYQAADLLQAPERFTPPTSAYATLGIVQGAAWLRIPLSVAPSAAGDWILDIDHAPLSRIDWYLEAGGTVLQHTVLGASVPFAERPLPGRSHAVPLHLAPGNDYVLLARVETEGPMVLPIHLERPAAFHARALDEQMLQGLFNGVALCLLVYSLAQWLHLRNALYGKYALMVGGSVIFSLLFSGVGGQYVWRDLRWMELHAVNLSALIATCGGFLFIEHALSRPGTLRRFGRAMKTGAALTFGLTVVYVVGGFGTQEAAPVINVLVMLPLLMGLPVALHRVWQRDPLGAPFLVAWAFYLAGSAVMVGVVNGRVPATFWTLHAFQFVATLDMLIFMRVLGLRSAALAAEARQLRTLARTDPLTGLLNRRGLEGCLQEALASRAPHRLVAVYLLDLDGFKPVNDRHGHDVGDALLVAIALRLRNTERQADPVARIGGDEFVVVSTGLESPDAAEARGHALMRVFDQSFQVQGLSLRVGATIGYALAPVHASDPLLLVGLADKAMYAGKQAGGRCLRRHETAPVAHG